MHRKHLSEGSGAFPISSSRPGVDVSSLKVTGLVFLKGSAFALRLLVLEKLEATR
jgi:hypothetical protein